MEMRGGHYESGLLDPVNCEFNLFPSQDEDELIYAW